MSDEQKADSTPRQDDLATLVAYARQNPKVAGALLADLEGLIRDQNLSIDTTSAAYQELVLRLYHARVVLDRNLDDFQNRAAAGLLGAAGGRAAYAAAARPEDLNAAYLNAAQPQDLNAAYLNAAHPQDLNAAYLNAAHPQDLSAAYLTAARPQDLNAAYLNTASPRDLPDGESR